MKYSQSSRAFSLIELLIVVAIISVLSIIVVMNLANARVKARDTKRKADFNQIQKALQLYHLEKGNMPINRTPGSAYNDSFNDFLKELVDEGLLGAAPKDPIFPTRNYKYYDYGNGGVRGAMIVSNLETYTGTGPPGSCRPNTGSNWCRSDISTNDFCICTIH